MDSCRHSNFEIGDAKMTSATHAIRQLMPTDADAFSALRRRVTADNPLPMGLTLAEEQSRTLEGFRQQLGAAAPNAAFGVFLDSELVGCSAVAWTSSFASSRHKVVLWGTFVSPSLRQQGFGKAAVRRALEHAKQNGARRANLTVYLPNPQAVSLYQSFGFKTYGIEPEAVQLEGIYRDGQLMSAVLFH
jgi:ribosomal protein S18 acetylase RimI-like enzyme